MKHSLLFLSLLSLLFLGSCASDDALTEQTQDPEPDVPTIPFTGTITSGNGPSAVAQALVADDGPFHALSDEGTTLKATWEVGDKMALIVGTALCEATVSEVNGNKANISAAIPATVSDGAEARLIYPYTAVDESTLEVKTDLLSEQDGSLATIAKNLDVCKGSGVLSVANNTAKLKADVTMAEQYCIWRLATQYNGSALNITKLTIKQGEETYTVNLSSAASSGIYVALKPAAATAYTFRGFPTIDGAAYKKDYSGVTLAAQKFYRSTLNLDFDELWFSFSHYMWDAKEWYWYPQSMTPSSTTTYPTVNDQRSDGYPTFSDPDRRYNDINIPVGYSNPIEYAATNSAKDMPNVNDLTWYFQYGDPHFDGTTEWSLGGVTQRGGLWLKKKQVIISEIQSSQPNVFVRDCSTDGSDWRNKQFMYLSATPATGRPDDTSDYFFLPAMGDFDDVGQLYDVGTTGLYWSSSPMAGDFNGEDAYNLYFNRDQVDVTYWGRYSGHVAGGRPDGTPWFK